MHLLLTAYRDKAGELIQELAGLGIFWQTDFADVVRGEVDDLEWFLDNLEERSPYYLSRLMPVKSSFRLPSFDTDEIFKEIARQLAEGIHEGETFCIRINRRGLKGVFSAQETASKVGEFVCGLLEEKYGAKPNVDLEDPDRAIVFETICKWCGVASISKEMRRRHRFIKLP
jgi:tRNA(Ser,Leu) C12 N-acetylase TAN1